VRALRRESGRAQLSKRLTPASPGATVAGEWTAPPPGRLGRRLLADIEPYLEFFAIARMT